MGKNNLNTNKQFMIVNSMLAFGVFVTIIIFLYISFRFQRKADKAQTYHEKFCIEVTRDFAGDSIAIYLNDSLLLSKVLSDADTTLTVNRFAEENVLMVVNCKTDITTPYSLTPKDNRLKIKKNGDTVLIQESTLPSK